MATIETSAEVLEVGSTWVRLRIGADGHQHRIRFDLPVDKDAQAFRDAMERGEKVRVTVEVPFTSRQNREAAEAMARDMAGEIEG